MTVGSLFAGIGGFDLGFERAGFLVAWQVERDPFCRAVLEQRWPHVKRYADVQTVGTAELPAVDVLTGGFPCQPHSLAGRRQGVLDERELWSAFARVVRLLRPRWLVAENVRGVLSTDAGRFFGTVLRDLAAIGYDAEWECVPAAAVGAPHRRERIWLVGYPHTDSGRCGRGGESEHTGQQGAPWNQSDGLREGRPRDRPLVADTISPRLEGHTGDVDDGHESERHTAPADRSTRPPRVFVGTIPVDDWWRVEPGMGRVAHGVPARVDRLRALGNALVPQIAEWIARRILIAEGIEMFFTYTRCSRCDSENLILTNERYDAEDDVVVGVQTCRECGALHLCRRRPTPRERETQPSLFE